MFAQNSLFDLPSLDSVIDRAPLTIPPHTSVAVALALMSQNQENRCELLDTDISQTLELLNREPNSCILVVEAGKLVGIFTERDAVKLTASQADLNGIALAEVMSRKLITLKQASNQTILTALSLLHRHQIRHLPILDDREELQGLITQSDLLSAIDPVELLSVVEMLQQQVGEKAAALEQSNQQLEQEISRRQQAEAESKQINESLEMLIKERTAELTHVNVRLQQEIEERRQAEKKLRETLRSLEFQKYALDRAAIVAITDHHGVITYVNEQFCQISKYKKEELIGQTHRIINSGYHPPEFFQELWRTIANGKIWQGEIKNKAKDGSFYWVETTIVPFLDESGKPFQYLAIRFDRTDRKQAEEDVRESKRRLSTLIANLPGYVYRVANDPNYTPEFISEGVFEITGYRQEEYLIERTISCGQEIHPDDRENVWNLVQQAIATKQPYECEYRIISQSGDQKWVWERGQGIRSDNGEILHLEGFVTDISERKQAEQKIREQAALLDVATDAILVRDLDRRIRFWNQGAETIYGWQASEAIGQDVRSLLSKEVSPKAETAYSTVLEKGEWQGELHQVAKTGKEIIVASRWTLMKDEVGNPQFILSVDTDITERKLLEAQFLRAQRLESLGTLASGISHDMNNILTPILAVSQLLPLKLSNLDQQNQQLLEILYENAKRGVDLVKQILSFARGAEGERTQIQIAHILTEVVKVARQTFPKSLEIQMDLARELWLVSGDATQLHQVLMNLFINARDAMPEGGALTVTAENLRVDESYVRMNLDAQVGSYVVITVTDTGIGIPKETMERIFEPFFTTKKPGKGTGLGLSTVIGIIKSHQGFVNVYSEIGKGTSFKLYLPADENIETTQSIEDLELLKGNGELILVVDDEVSVREITKATLENYNYRVITANDGIGVIALYAQHHNEIAVVLLDLMMPSLDTSTIIQTLERINPQVKIIAMSGLSSNGEVVNTNYACVQVFLTKPFTSHKILQTLHDTLNAN
jgi:PAS domain S-box-containing protein